MPTEPAKIAAFRRIVDTSTRGKIDGVRVDLLSASAVIAVYDKLTQEENRAKFLAMPVPKMCAVAFKLVK